MALRRQIIYVILFYVPILIFFFIKFQVTVHKQSVNNIFLNNLYEHKPWDRKLVPQVTSARHVSEDRNINKGPKSVKIFTYKSDGEDRDSKNKASKERQFEKHVSNYKKSEIIPNYMHEIINDIVATDTYTPIDCTDMEKKKHFVFVKTHKCASDTVAAIGRRFALEHHLNLVLPLGQHFLLGWPYQMEPFMYRKRKTEHYDILLDHIVYNRRKLNNVMPDDTVYFTILRKPINRLISAVHYFGIGPCSFMPYKQEDYMKITDEYLRDLDMYDSIYTSPSNMFNLLKCTCVPKGISMVKNAMAFDLGFTSPFHIMGTDQSNNYTHIASWLRKMYKEMTFVMITEYFDESMVYLKR